MELAPMFVEQRWNILKKLSRRSLSPLQLAEQSNTTIANISQQLRLLEAANLVKKVRVPNRDRGQPRLLFSLSEDHAYIVSVMSNFAEKKLVRLGTHQKALLKIFSVEDEPARDLIENAYLQLRPHLDKVDSLAIDTAAGGLVVVTQDKALSRKAAAIEGVKVLSATKFAAQATHLVSLHDSTGLYARAMEKGVVAG